MACSSEVTGRPFEDVDGSLAVAQALHLVRFVGLTLVRRVDDDAYAVAGDRNDTVDDTDQEVAGFDVVGTVLLGTKRLLPVGVDG
jgi:hypothetical protein